MFIPPKIAIEDYFYDLPEDRIAFSPAKNRSDSKLLVWNQALQAESNYRQIAQYLPESAALFFNNSKVIAARLQFEKTRGNASNSIIEIFCLEPSEKYKPVILAMQATTFVEWYCLVGGAKKWKEPFLMHEIIYGDKKIQFKATKIKQEAGQFLIRFSWEDASISFSEIIQLIGKIPLPPYIQRAATKEDQERYQTTYAVEEGSVAAPTAGLHFNKEVFDSLEQLKITQHYVTLHVGAGTFMPVKTETIDAHQMHAEFIELQIDCMQQLIDLKNNIAKPPIVAVGTTTLRTLESLYWLGVKKYKEMIKGHHTTETELSLGQWEAYELAMEQAGTAISAQEALTALIKWMHANNCTQLFATTQLMIIPGYQFKICNGLITNFHQPKSTLLLIIAAIVKEQWKTIYQHAIANQYRFLSYGDGSLFWIHQQD